MLIASLARTTLAIGTLFAASCLAYASDPTGRWTTIDDETGQPKSIVEVSRQGDGTLAARVVQILQSDRGPNPTCTRCSGDRKDQPIEGMTILWGLRPGGEGWEGGTILDPANGRTYRSRVKLIDDNQLGVTGCLAFICREQVWRRE